MSGGHFDYKQYQIEEIIDSIERELEAAAQEKPAKVRHTGWTIWKLNSESSKSMFQTGFATKTQALKYLGDYRDEYIFEKDADTTIIVSTAYGRYEVSMYDYEAYPDDKYYPEYEERTINQFKKGIMYLRFAAVYAQRIDWLLSGDDGEETFHKRLKEDLEKLPKFEELCSKN